MKKIVRTSEQYRRELNGREKDRICPECGGENISLGTYHLKNYGFLHLHAKKVITYTCMNCGCQYEIEEDYF